MDPNTQALTGYYLWQPPGRSVVVHLHLDVIDRLLAEVMRGFGAVPKRGAEVGGLLLGRIEAGVIRVDDFEAVACDYKRGPSYLFTADDAAAFDEAFNATDTAVGYFRSHTREGLSMAPEDIDLMGQYFPSPSHVALLVKPFATKVSVASFFVREGGRFPTSPLLEFPFRRRELTGEEAPARRPITDRGPRRREPRAMVQSIAPEEEVVAAQASTAYDIPLPREAKPRTGWRWIPLSFVFLLLGVALGFLASLTTGVKGAGADYTLGLTITKDGDNMSVRWNRDASAVRAAPKGLLEIEDGSITKPIDLDAAQLRNGNLLFRNSSKTVRFRLVVYPQDGVSVTQVMEWQGQ